MFEILIGILLLGAGICLAYIIFSDREVKTHIVCWKCNDSEIIHSTRPMSREEAERIVLTNAQNSDDQHTFWYEEYTGEDDE